MLSGEEYLKGCEISARGGMNWDYEFLVTEPIDVAVATLESAFNLMLVRLNDSLTEENVKTAECLFHDAFMYRDCTKISILRNKLRSKVSEYRNNNRTES